MNKLLIVFNTCGIKRESPSLYVKHIKSILDQKNVDFHIAVSSCMNSEECIEYVTSLLGDKVSYNLIKNKLPISVTFNDTVDQCIKNIGEFENYMYIDSGIDFEQNTMAISDLMKIHESGPYSMTCARTDDDMGFDDWFGTDQLGNSIFSRGDLVVPVGKAANLHAQIFSSEHLKAYKKILPDIFAGQCMESVFSFMCAAINKKWIISSNIIVKHITGMDGPSSGFSPAEFVMERSMPRWNHLFRTSESIVDIIGRGIEYGMGYEENQSIVMHNDDQYDENGFCKNNKLSSFIRDNLYLRNDQFDYDKIKRDFIK